MATETGRLSAAEIFDRVTTGGAEELKRPFFNLLFSGVAAGLSMGISALGVALVLAQLGDTAGAEALAYLLYPLGFLTVILGRQQLFTENTLFPVALVLDERRHLPALGKLWGTVLLANVTGTALFSSLAILTPSLSEAAQGELSRLGVEAAGHSVWTIFWSGVIGGWLIAMVAWLVTASTTTTGQLTVIFLLTYAVGIGHFAHSIAGSAELLSAVLAGDLPPADYPRWLAAAVLGNAVGGVVIVALFAYGQVSGAPASLDAKPEEAATPM
jgi:formate-nitrite transporter family protein